MSWRTATYMWASGRPPIVTDQHAEEPNRHAEETDWHAQLHRVIPSALHQSWLRRTAARLRHHILLSLLPLLALLIPLALVGRHAGIPDALSFLLNFLALVLLTRLFILSAEVVVANIGLSPNSELLARFVHGTINTLLSCLDPIMIGLVCIVKDETRLAEVFIVGCIVSDMLLGTGAVLLVGGVLHMYDDNGVAIMQSYPSANGQLWSLRCMLASIAPLAVHFVAGSGDERAESGRLISRGAAIFMLLIHSLWVLFRYRTHRNLFEVEDTIQEMRHQELRETAQQLRQGIFSWRSMSLLSWLSVFICPILGTATAANLVNTTEGLAQTLHLSKDAVGLTLLPLVGIIPTLVETLTAAAKNRMDLAVHLTLGSSIDIAYVALPTLVLIGWMNDKPMSMNFGYAEVVELGASAWLIGRTFQFSKSTYLDGATILSLYLIVSLANFTLY